MYNASSINFYSVLWFAQSKVWQEICSMCCHNIDDFTLPACFVGIILNMLHLWKKITASILYSLAGQHFFSNFHLQYLSRFCFHALICLLRNHWNGPWYTKRNTLCADFFWIFLILAWALILNVSLSAEIWLYVFWPLRQVCARKFHCVMLQIAVSTFGTRLCRCTCRCFSIFFVIMCTQRAKMTETLALCTLKLDNEVLFLKILRSVS